MTTHARGICLALLLGLALTACRHSRSADKSAASPPPRADGSGLLNIGAAKRSIQPTDAHIAGVSEPRLFGGGTHVQKFNLGGFGINPVQNFPDPVGAQGEQLTTPAGQRVYTNAHGQQEDMQLRLMVIEQPGATPVRVAFVMIDAIGAGNLIQEGLKNAINQASCDLDACIEPDHILFGQTHSHTAADLQGLWGGVPQDWIANVLYKSAADAAAEALRQRQPAHLKFRQGDTTDFNNYRRPRVNPADDADGTITLLSATAIDGSPIGNILQYNAHPTTVGAGEHPRTPHSEYILGAMDWLERNVPGANGPGGVSLYYQGPIADASPSGTRAGCEHPESDTVFERVRCRGEGIADYLLNPATPEHVLAQGELAPTLEVRSAQATLPITNPLFVGAGLLGTSNRYYSFTQLPVGALPLIGGAAPPGFSDLPQTVTAVTTTVSRVTLGGADHGLEIVTIPGEATHTFGNYIRSLAKTRVMLMGLTHNSFGYIIPEEEFSYIEPNPNCVEPSEDPFCNAGFVLPFSGYEEFVSLGPLTAPLLRLQAYNPLFDAPPEKNTPPEVAACADLQDRACVLNRYGYFVDYIQRGYARLCRDQGGPEAFCSQIDPDTPLSEPCHAQGLPDGICAIFSSTPARALASKAAPQDIVTAAIEAATRGCDMLDPANCLYPFPSDHFTAAAAAGSPQSAEKGGTGLRVNFSLLAMPRNAAGKPIDPTEWNRNDGFSPGAMIVAYVPNLGTVKDADGQPFGPVTGAAPLTDLRRYADADAPILLLDADSGERQMIWAEIDLNAGLLIPAVSTQASPLPKKPALIIRPAKNLVEGHRYVVVLRNLKDGSGQPIAAQGPFEICRDQDTTYSALPPVMERCQQLEDKVFPLLARVNIARDDSLYLAWDFTIASASSVVGRLVHIRDDAFHNVLHEPAQAPNPGEPGYPAGDAPAFKISRVTENPDGDGGKTVRRVQGTITVPSYVVPADPAAVRAAPGQPQLQQIADQCQQVLMGMCEVPGVASLGDAVEVAGSASLPPNRLFYRPDDGAPVSDPTNLFDPTGLRYGDGLPDRNPSGDLTMTFTCNIPRSAVNGAADMASAKSVNPVRPSLYGHGLLGGQGEVNGQAADMGNVYGLMYCAADWFGFATGDIVNVLGTLADLSSFPVVPDGSTQGMLNQLFLARLLVHPQGFAADPNFQVAGQAVFDRREVFYDGNSQGGILGGVVVAASKDINRGVLGVIGMNYSTLLSRSTDFATYSIPLYLAYADDLDRPAVFALMQMLWDRSENDGFAAHITDNSAMTGPGNALLLHPAIGDHQVSMWTAEVMARTVGAKLDRHRVRPERHPDVDAAEYFNISPVDFAGAAQYSGSALAPYDQMFDAATGAEHWDSQNDGRCDANKTNPPPVGNVPPGTAAGDDPHECPRRDPQARCQMSHFLLGIANAQAGGTAPSVVDVSGIAIFPAPNTSAGCPAVNLVGAPAS